tara:strand:+ start:72 stop:470 length:399 start_codon:yes stop_codon:yes gene_type:complete
MKLQLTIYMQIIFFSLIGQEYINSFDKIEPDNDYDNIYVKKLSSETDATTFAIWIKKSVRLHKHIEHIENVYITEGNGDFQLGDTIYNVKSGDLIVIPKNTWHGVIVNSQKPMKVISIQSPEFYGKDRIFKK